jgi:hypothetical protein
VVGRRLTLGRCAAVGVAHISFSIEGILRSTLRTVPLVLPEFRSTLVTLPLSIL